jgi:hypothetical protein
VPEGKLVSGKQNLTAYIQANLGANLMSIESLFSWARGNDMFSIKSPIREGRENDTTILTSAPLAAHSIMHSLNWNREGPIFKELHGLLTIMSMYLILGRYHPTTLLDKNIAPFLCRTPLNEVMDRILKDQHVLNTVGLSMLQNKENVITKILEITGRERGDYLIHVFKKTTPKCGEWILAVLNGKNDSFTKSLDSNHFLSLKEENVGPNPANTSAESSEPTIASSIARGKGPVLELRHPFFIPTQDGRYPIPEWHNFAQFLMTNISRINTTS